MFRDETQLAACCRLMLQLIRARLNTGGAARSWLVAACDDDPRGLDRWLARWRARLERHAAR